MICPCSALSCCSQDHTPDVPSEYQRIVRAGGFVQNKRVNGVLAVSRSFGDLPFKNLHPSRLLPLSPDASLSPARRRSRNFGPLPVTTAAHEAQSAHGIWSEQQQVTSQPCLLDFPVEAGHEFAVIASDGLWNVFSDQVQEPPGALRSD